MAVKVNRGFLDQNYAFQIHETRNFLTTWISTRVWRPCRLPPRTFIVIKPNNVLRRVTIPTVQWAGSREAVGAGVPPEAAPAARTIATLRLIKRSHHLARITWEIWESMKRKLCTPTSRNTFPMSEVQTGLFSRTYILSSDMCFKINFDRTVGEMCIFPQYLGSITCQLFLTNTLRIKPKWMFSPLKPVTGIIIKHTKKIRQHTWSNGVLHSTC